MRSGSNRQDTGENAWNYTAEENVSIYATEKGSLSCLKSTASSVFQRSRCESPIGSDFQFSPRVQIVEDLGP
jgi:hypothetical protein